MGLFGYKNNNKEFTTIESFCKEIDYLFNLDKFISRKEYINFYNDTLPVYNELQLMGEKNILKEWCKKNSIDYKLLSKYMDEFANMETLVKEHNNKFISKHLKSDKEYLDNILKKDDPNIILDEEQRKVVLSDEDYILGFPSKIEDDPVMKLVIKDDENIDYAEERRLFYVALTRTKNRVYLITPQYHPSKFILEIKDQFTNVILKGVELNPTDENDLRRKCPNCGYPLQRRKSNFKFMLGSKTLWICSNDPEICGFMTNDLKGGYLSISKCPECEDGYLIVKPIRNTNGEDTGNRMLGCTNYKKDGTGCKGYLMPYNYTQDKGKLAIEFYDKNMKIDKMILMGYPIKELVYRTLDCIKIVEAKYSNFQFSLNSLSDFLRGKESKVINSFKLNGLRNFGMIKKIYYKQLQSFLNELIKEEILSVVKKIIMLFQ